MTDLFGGQRPATAEEVGLLGLVGAADGSTYQGERCIPIDADTLHLFATVDNALTMGSDMTAANHAFTMICDELGIDRDALAYVPERASEARGRVHDLLYGPLRQSDAGHEEAEREEGGAQPA